MKKISGITTFIGCSIGALGSLYGLFETFNRWSEYDSESAFKDMLLIALIVIAFSLGIYYTVITKFGFSSKPTVLDNLERENEIIKKQIEKRELLTKLENLEKK
ncbi:MAG: hypothetical protein WD824_21210 [Cyclobacteriaceae bacterium]